MTGSSGRKGIGIIGYGGFGEFIHQTWDRMENARVTAVCDSDPGRNPGGVSFHVSADDLLADPSVDIVSVATPPSTHRDLAIRAMQAGKHVLVEKPIALTEQDALLIKRVAEETGRVTTVNFVLRFNAIVEKLRQIVRTEALGKLRRVDLRNYAMQETVPEGHWFWNPEVSGRILVEHGVHFFDLASWMIQAKAASISSLGVERKPGMEDRVFAAVRYENGVVGTYWHSFSRPRPLETTTFHFAFDLGEVEMIGWIPLELRIWGWTGQQGLATIRGLSTAAKIEVKDMGEQPVDSSEFRYQVRYDLSGRIELAEPKLEVYAENLRSIMADLIRAIDDPSHRMRVTIDDAIEAVRTAERATAAAHPEG